MRAWGGERTGEKGERDLGEKKFQMEEKTVRWQEKKKGKTREGRGRKDQGPELGTSPHGAFLVGSEEEGEGR